MICLISVCEGSAHLACWQVTAVPCEVCWRWRGSQLEKVKALGCLAGGETCEERRATGPGYSARPGCSTRLTCSRRDSERPLYLWAGRQWTLTGPENTQGKSRGRVNKGEKEKKKEKKKPFTACTETFLNIYKHEF